MSEEVSASSQDSSNSGSESSLPTEINSHPNNEVNAGDVSADHMASDNVLKEPLQAEPQAPQEELSGIPPKQQQPADNEARLQQLEEL